MPNRAERRAAAAKASRRGIFISHSEQVRMGKLLLRHKQVIQLQAEFISRLAEEVGKERADEIRAQMEAEIIAADAAKQEAEDGEG